MCNKLRKEINALLDLYKNSLRDDYKDSKVYKHRNFNEIDIDNNFKSLKRHIKYSLEEYGVRTKKENT
jgi:hypothetical protein